jgi:hypothetical protein
LKARGKVLHPGDDALILAYGRGEMPLYALKNKVRCRNDVLAQRARELGVQVEKIPHAHYDDLTPARIRDDKLLKRLVQVHGDRYYDDTFAGSPHEGIGEAPTSETSR